MLRIGLIGTGGIARRHLEELLAIPEVQITAVVDLSLDRARWATDLTGATFYPRVQDILPKVDAAYVLTPPRARVEVIRTLAEGGKAIFCEKPLAATLEDAQIIYQIVSETNVPFMMGFMRRRHPAYRALKHMIDSGEIGRPIQFFRQRLGYLPQPKGNWRVDPTQLCGLTIESASHDIDLLRWLGGDILAASGQVMESNPELPGFDDSVSATLRFANGAIGMLQASWASLVSANQVGVIGDHAAALITGDGMWNSLTLTRSTSSHRQAQVQNLPSAESENDGYHGQTQSFIRLAHGEEINYPSVADGLATVEVSHQILSSSTTPTRAMSELSSH